MAKTGHVSIYKLDTSPEEMKLPVWPVKAVE